MLSVQIVWIKFSFTTYCLLMQNYCSRFGFEFHQFLELIFTSARGNKDKTGLSLNPTLSYSLILSHLEFIIT